jgi:hypothetical protein
MFSSVFYLVYLRMCLLHRLHSLSGNNEVLALECEKVYVGQTVFSVETRVNEHHHHICLLESQS